MIGMLKGEVAVRRTDHVVILCAGVGYRAAVSAETLRHVPAAGEETTLHSHLIVRDDALSLYGFHSEEERDLFLCCSPSRRSVRRWRSPYSPGGRRAS